MKVRALLTQFDEVDHKEQKGCQSPMELFATSFEQNEEIPLKYRIKTLRINIGCIFLENFASDVIIKWPFTINSIFTLCNF